MLPKSLLNLWLIEYNSSTKQQMTDVTALGAHHCRMTLVHAIVSNFDSHLQIIQSAIILGRKLFLKLASYMNFHSKW